MRFLKSNIDGPGRILVTGLVSVVFGASGCRLDMHDAPRYDAMERSDLFENGSSARPLVEGTVARGEFHPDESAFYTGFGDAGFVKGLPPGVDVTREFLIRGKERYDIFCSPCHGYTGAGDGMIVQRGFRAPPTYHNARNREEGLGRIFYIITNGYGQMYSYGHAIKPHDRWAIAAYIRALQLSQSAPLSAVAEKDRARLEEDTL